VSCIERALATGTILDEIVAWKRVEVAQQVRERPLGAVQEAAATAPPPRDWIGALRQPGVSLIAEVKRASPSAGLLRPGLDPAALAAEYAAGGAAALSVLTDARYFQGSLDDLRAARAAAALPVLRKDFTVSSYQLYEARAAGADAVLLIVAVLGDEALTELHQLAQALGMAALVEVHGEAELERALALQPRVIGVNNRDLHTFQVDLRTMARLHSRIPDEVVLVAESGVHVPADVAQLADMGADAMLVGEALVRTARPRDKARELVEAGQRGGNGG
jgi:indole-3-glycerol phosphate synthase